MAKEEPCYRDSAVPVSTITLLSGRAVRRCDRQVMAWLVLDGRYVCCWRQCRNPAMSGSDECQAHRLEEELGHVAPRYRAGDPTVGGDRTLDYSRYAQAGQADQLRLGEVTRLTQQQQEDKDESVRRQLRDIQRDRDRDRGAFDEKADAIRRECERAQQLLQYRLKQQELDDAHRLQEWKQERERDAGDLDRLRGELDDCRKSSRAKERASEALEEKLRDDAERKVAGAQHAVAEIEQSRNEWKDKAQRSTQWLTRSQAVSGQRIDTLDAQLADANAALLRSENERKALAATVQSQQQELSKVREQQAARRFFAERQAS